MQIFSSVNSNNFFIIIFLSVYAVLSNFGDDQAILAREILIHVLVVNYGVLPTGCIHVIILVRMKRLWEIKKLNIHCMYKNIHRNSYNPD